MTAPTDLDALDALHAAGTAGEWGICREELSRDFSDEEQEAAFPRTIGPLSYIEHDSDDVDVVEADAALIVALRNAYPAIAAELRRARKIEAAARALAHEVNRVERGQTTYARSRVYDRLGDFTRALDAPDEKETL